MPPPNGLLPSVAAFTDIPCPRIYRVPRGLASTYVRAQAVRDAKRIRACTEATFFLRFAVEHVSAFVSGCLSAR